MLGWQIGYAFIAAAEIALFVYAVRLLRRGRKVKVGDAVIMLPLLLALSYDNTMLALGNVLGENDVHRLFSGPRYITHALMTPLLLVYAALSADRLKVPGFEGNRSRITIWGAIAFFAIWYGLWNDLVHIELMWDTTGDAGGRYANHGHVGPPLPVMATGLGLLLIGASITRHARSPWIFLSSIVMLVVVLFFPEYGVIVNLGELTLVTGMLMTGTAAVRAVERDRAARRDQALSDRRRDAELVDVR
jgi:hypothetical protein